MLRIKNLNKSYDHPVISSFSYDFPEKGLFMIRGASGCGKTTLFRLILGLEKPDSGEIERSEEKKISVVFQEPRLLEFKTVLENVLFVSLTKPDEEARERAEQILRNLGLEEAKNLYPSALSGGMKGRVAVARSLFYGGDIYLWDEPTKELDAKNRLLIMREVEKIAKKSLVIIISHDPELQGGTEINLETN